MLEFITLVAVALVSGVVGAGLACFGIIVWARAKRLEAAEKSYEEWSDHQ